MMLARVAIPAIGRTELTNNMVVAASVGFARSMASRSSGELDALTFKNGIALATDDVLGKELVPTLVQSTRDEEIAYFTKRGVYRIVSRSRQRSTGGKVIWDQVGRQVVGHRGAESPLRSRLQFREARKRR